MKKFLTCILVFILLLQNITFAKSSNLLEEAVKELGELGIMSGDEDGKFKHEDYVTRAEFAVIVVRIMNLDELAETANYQNGIFHDVDSNHWAAGSIYTLYSLGMLNGVDINRFDPNGTITLNQAIKMLVSALGYNVEALKLGGYPSGYMSIAQTKRLLNHISVSGDSEITRGDAAILIYNSLDVPILEKNFGSSEEYKAKTNSTIRKNRLSNLELLKGRGILSAVGSESIDAIDDYDEDEALIDGVKFNAGNVNIRAYLGMEVEYYYSYNDDDIMPRLTMVTPTKRNTVITINDSNLIDVDLNNNLIKYENIRDEKVVLDENRLIVFNGKLLQFPKYEDVFVKYGYIDLIDNNADDKYDIIFVHSQESAIVESYRNDSNIIKLRDNMSNGSIVIEIKDDREYMYTFLKNGRNINPDEILTNDVVTLEISKDKKRNKIIVSGNNFVGIADEISAQDRKIKVDGKSYEIANNYLIKDISNINVGMSYEFYLDMDERIVFAEESSNSLPYGYFIDIKMENTVNRNFIAKILLHDKVEVYSLADRIRIDDIMYSGNEIVNEINKQKVFLVYFNSDKKINRLISAKAYGTKSKKRYNEKYNAFRDLDPFRINESTKVLMIPTNPTEDEDYLTAVSLKNNTLIDCQAYDLDEKTQVAGLLLVYGSFAYEKGGHIEKDSVVSMVDRVSRRLTEEGHEEKMVWLYQYDKYMAVPVREGSEIYTVVDNLKTGDLIRYSVNTLGKMDNIELVSTNIDTMPVFHNNVTDQIQEIKGYVFAAKTNWLKTNSNVPANILYVSTNKNGSSPKTFVMETAVENGIQSPVYCIDKGRNTIYPYDFSMIKSIENYGQIEETVYIYAENSAVQAAVVITR